MHGKVIGFNLTDVATRPLLELNNFSTPSRYPGWTHCGGYPYQRGGEVNSRSPQDAYLLREGQLQKNKDGEESGSGADSGWCEVSNNSCTDSESTRFDAAYEAFRDLSEVFFFWTLLRSS